MSIDRNQPCPCGSGRKYKKCCLPKEQATAAPVEAGWLRMRRTEGELVERIMALFHRDYGRVAFDLGWDEYTLWTDEAPDAEEWPELEAAFVAWLLFNWEPGRHAARRRRRPDGRVTTATGDALPAVTPARHLMARRGGDLDSYERRWLEEACTQPYTFCQVVAVEPGQRLDLRDLLLKRDVTVQERQASKTLSAGNVIYTKIVSLDGESVMLGCAPIVLPGNRVGMILEARDLILRRRGTPLDLVRRHDVEFRDLYLALRREQMDPRPAGTDEHRRRPAADDTPGLRAALHGAAGPRRAAAADRRGRRRGLRRNLRARRGRRAGLHLNSVAAPDTSRRLHAEHRAGKPRPVRRPPFRAGELEAAGRRRPRAGRRAARRSCPLQGRRHRVHGTVAGDRSRQCPVARSREAAAGARGP
ncbi:MAG: SEC-C domain-containing protein [bacterium]|nr:SEC-C domain-containing protein [bacterium]